tara:strand:+ start:26997 stop:30563 length:3567 start_codon:yes stop_codon:yes gene_type:complete
MAINATDVQIMRPERVTDNTDGGGQMTGTAIASGDVNNLWDDIPRTMLAYGGVSLRKLFCAIRSANVDKFLGGHAIIQSDSLADNVSTLLFSTGDHYDERLSAQDKIEQFVVMGTRSPLRPVGTQRKGQTAVVMYADKESDAPRNGDVLVFKSPAVDQYVKVTDVSFQRASYTYVLQDKLLTYSAVEFTIRISQPLDVDFVGADPSPVASHGFEVFKTQSASSAHYYGIKPVVTAATIGDAEIKADGIFQHIVPVATTETALLDQTPGLSARVVQPSASAVVTKSLGNKSGIVDLTLPCAFVPGSLKVTISNSVYRDEGTDLELKTGTSRLNSGVVNAAQGTVSLNIISNSSVTIEYVPGVAVELTPYTDSVKINAGNRQLTYTEQLSPVPMPGSLRVEYQYLGNWYELTDNGSGVISGEGASGVANYDTGSVSFSLPAEPDVNSSLIYTWSRSPYVIDSAVAFPAVDAFFNIELPNDVVAGSVSLAWSKNGTSYTATEGVDQLITGSGSGEVRGNAVQFMPSQLPDSDIVVSYKKRSTALQTIDVNISQKTGGNTVIDLGATGISPASVGFTLSASYVMQTNVNGIITETTFGKSLRAVGTAEGAVKTYNGYSHRGLDVIIGTIDSATGIITINGDALEYVARDYLIATGTSKLGGGQFVSATRTSRLESQTLSVRFRSPEAGTDETHTVLLADAELTVPTPENIVPGSYQFSLNGLKLIDRSDGAVLSNWNEETAAGVAVGQINHGSGDVVINYNAVRNEIVNLSCNVLSMATGIGAASAVHKVVFRTSATPLRPSGLQFLARRASDTALLRAESQNNGDVSGSFNASDKLGELVQPGSVNGYTLPIIAGSQSGGSAIGNVNYQTGIIELTFSQPVILSTLTYNAVAYNTVPLNADVLGLNPVKLPTDGRVPVFQPGYLVVIHNSKSLEVATPTANQVIDCSRINLAQLEIIDSAGTGLALDQYVVDKLAGTATLADPFNAVDSAGVALVMPLTVNHRIEDICAVGNVNIDGTLGLLTQLTHDYSAGDSYVSSAISFGTMQGRIYNVFSQKINQSGVFKDELEGDATVASYDDINYPILIDNKSAVQERWKIRFTNNSAFELIGETLGVVGVGSTSVDFSPINPMTDAPYFTIKAAGWGGGWITNNMLRFNTDAAAKPIWAIRTVLPSTEPVEKDFINIEFRGDAD